MMIGPIDADTPEVCFQVTVVQDGVCEGSVDGEGVPSPEVFTVVVRTEDGSDIEVRGSNRVATITIEDSAECSTLPVYTTANKLPSSNIHFSMHDHL